MALQRTRRPTLRSGRSLRSLGSPLNAYPLGVRRSTVLIRSALLAALFAFSPSEARSGGDCGFPWTVTAAPAGDERLTIALCGVETGCSPHNRQVSVVGSEIRVTYTQGEAPNGCSCIQPTFVFTDTVIVELSPGTYTVTVVTVDCAIPTVVGTGTVILGPSASIPTLDVRGAIALAILLVGAAVWRMRS